MTKLAIIVAVANNGVIGSDNSIPWHCPADLKYFKRITMGAPILMGRKTYQSLKIKPLPGRQNIILTRDHMFHCEACDVVHSLDEALALVKDKPKLFIIGGAEIYKQSINIADEVYITHVDIDAEGDRFFPDIDLTQWQCVSEQVHPKGEDSLYDLVFKRYIRND